LLRRLASESPTDVKIRLLQRQGDWPSCRGEAKSEWEGQPRREKREESFMPVEITVGGLGRRKGLGEELFLGWFASGPFGSAQDKLKPRPPEERRRKDGPFANSAFRFEACEKFAAEVLRTSLSDALRMTASDGAGRRKTRPPEADANGAHPENRRARHPAEVTQDPHATPAYGAPGTHLMTDQKKLVFRVGTAAWDGG
jgi:hypothetical protein